MEKLLKEYKDLKSQLTPNVGCEESVMEVGWNDQIKESMENLLKDVPKDISERIILNHI